MNYISKCARFYATLGPIGYATAPGTLASFWGLGVVIALSTITQGHPYYCALILCIIFLTAFYAVRHTLKGFKGHLDPSEIVIDELLGILIAFYAIPLTTPILIIGFIIFRILDITKTAGIHYCERLNGASGVLADDIYAGFLTNIALRLLFV